MTKDRIKKKCCAMLSVLCYLCYVICAMLSVICQRTDYEIAGAYSTKSSACNVMGCRIDPLWWTH